MRYLCCIVLFLCQKSFSQNFSANIYPNGYFRNPLGIPISLSGNFGELRPNHYHMGLDIRTNAKQNLPVYAAAEGYIARIKIEPGGFGRAIYINHPNGFTTLYAHLNDFNPKLEAWLKQQQYQLESWAVFLELEPSQFPVKKGELIAYSGNTGGSQAPHLHFEIRSTKEDVNLNPLLFGFSLADKTSPKISRLAIFDRTKSVYEQSPKLVPVKWIPGKSYTSTPSVVQVNSPLISLGLSTTDSHSGSTRANGIYESELKIDGLTVISFRMDSISYNDTRYLNAHIDYRTRSWGGPYIQHLSELPGYVNSIYNKETGNGVIDLSDEQPHSIQITVKDAYGNSSTLHSSVQYRKNAATAGSLANRMGKTFYPLMLDGYEGKDCEFYIGERCLYDSVFINYSQSPGTNGAISALHRIGSSGIPLQEPYLIRIKADRSLTESEKTRTVMQWIGSSRQDVQKVEWQDSWASAKFRDFGAYQLIIDEESPQIIPIGFANGSNLSKASRIVFTVRDNLAKFKNVRAELDGKWLRFTNDKGRTFIYRFDEKCLAGQHELKITAEDEAGNVTTAVYRFTR